MICPNCEKKLPNNEVEQCPFCGCQFPPIEKSNIAQSSVEKSIITPPSIQQTEQKACPQCGKVITKDAVCCKYCGANTQVREDIVKDNEQQLQKQESLQETIPNNKFCKHCGKEILVTAKFCKYCGTTC